MKGGFDDQDSMAVVESLAGVGIDLIEVSGGTYEQPKLLGVEGLEATEEVDPALLVQVKEAQVNQPQAKSTRQREAYFAEFALAMQARVKIPLMVTGGMRQRVVMEEVISSGSADVIGLGRPLCVQPDAPQQLLNGAETKLHRSFSNETEYLISITTSNLALCVLLVKYNLMYLYIYNYCSDLLNYKK